MRPQFSRHRHHFAALIERSSKPAGQVQLAATEIGHRVNREHGEISQWHS